jgi:predicted metalloendopeptidase
MTFNLAIGWIVGHEIAYAFDELNRYIDKDGKKFTLWSNQTSDVFDKRSKCIVEQYNNYTVSQIKRQVCLLVKYISKDLS